MVPRLPQETFPSTGERNPSAAMSTFNSGEKTMKYTTNNHILSQWGYRSPKRRSRSPEIKLLRQSTSPMRPQQHIYDYSSKLDYGDGCMVDPYKMLQIRRDATRAEIKEAYGRLALWHHPRRQSAKPMPEQESMRRQIIFALLAACCETLLERDSRGRLDALLRAQATRTAPVTPAPSLAGSRSGGQQQHPLNANGGDLLISHDIVSDFDSASDLSSRSEHAEEFYDNWFDWICGESHSINGAQNKTQKCGTRPEEADRMQTTKAETNRLYSGPLYLLYRARLYRSFSDPFVVFAQHFGSEVFPTTKGEESSFLTHTKALALSETLTPPSNSPTCPSGKSRSTAWAGSVETFPDGTTVYTTTRTLNGRKIIKREEVYVDPVTGQKRSTISVTGQDLYEENLEQQNPTKARDTSSYWNCCAPSLAFSNTAKKDDTSSDGCVATSDIYNDKPPSMFCCAFFE